MSWKKHFQVVNTDRRLKTALEQSQRDANVPTSGALGKYSSVLPEVYAGHPLRIERYSQYDQMDMDSEVNTALDTIADFCTQRDANTDELFEVVYHDPPADAEIEILKTCLHQWCKINEFRKRVWRTFRSTLKYGDQFFIRDPETLKWFWVEQTDVEKILVNEATGKEPEAYLIRNLNLNLTNLSATQSQTYGNNIQGMGTSSLSQLGISNISTGRTGGPVGATGHRYNSGNSTQNLTAIDATHVVHLSLSEGLDANWPFGTSILESVFKVFKQKELLEDAIIIYRIIRAPERRIFYVDVGQMPPHKAAAYLERVKNEIHQKRMPSKNGGGASVVDAGYSAMSMIDDYFFASSADGRGSKVETLPGGENLGQIDDLRYWNNKLIRGLRVPSSYLPTGPDDGQQTYNDGRAGTAYIQEFRFAQYCQRLQNLLSPVFDKEFKLFVKQRGFNIDSSIFELNFTMPQHFSDYARAEKDTAMINVFSPLVEQKYFSKRFLMKRYLGMTDDEISENELQWRQENPDAVENTGESGGAGSASSSAGGAPPGIDSMGLENSSDPTEAEDPADNTGDSPISGAENAPTDPTAAAPPAPGVA